MPSPDPASVRYFEKLPVELLKHIVGMIKRQDDAFKASKIGQVERSKDAATTDEEWDICAGIWSSCYGRGTAMLALIDKRTRQVAFPLLCEVRLLSFSTL
jgi:hypothetical protein